MDTCTTEQTKKDKTLNLNLYNVKIDSLKMAWPSTRVKIVDPTFHESYHKIYIESGFVDEKHINLDQHKVSEISGIKTRVGIVTMLRGEQHHEMVFFQCNAKMLQSDYFQGISTLTIEKIYNYLIDLKIIFIEWDDFLNGQVSDIDFCYDFFVSPRAMVFGNKEIYARVLPEKNKFVLEPFAHTHKGEFTNIGLQFNERKKATPANPFTKLYHKTTELKHNSSLFAETFLQGLDYENVGRLEFQLKNYRHKKRLNLTFTTLRELLFMTQDQLDIINNEVETGFTKYLVKTQRLLIREDLSPTDRVLLYFIDHAIQNGADKTSIFQVLEIFKAANPDDEKAANKAATDRCRMKKKLTKIWENYDVEANQEVLKQNAETLAYLRQLKLDIFSLSEKPPMSEQ